MDNTTATYLRISDLVRDAADRFGLTQDALAQSVGLTREQFNARINNRTRWTVTEVAALAKLLDLDLYTLLDAASDGDEVLSC